MESGPHAFVLKFNRRYSMAHRLISGVAPNCRVPHGHDEVVGVEIAESSNEGLEEETNMLVEFSRLKGRWFEWVDKAVDHSFHIGNGDPLIAYFRRNEPELLPRLLVTPGDPTTEMRAACFAAKVAAFLLAEHPGFLCLRLTIQETPTNAVEFRPQESQAVVPFGDGHWWNRADLSINDLEAA